MIGRIDLIKQQARHVGGVGLSNRKSAPASCEEDVTVTHDVTTTGGASSSSASGGPAMGIDSQPPRKRVADVHMEDLEGDKKMSRTQSVQPALGVRGCWKGMSRPWREYGQHDCE